MSLIETKDAAELLGISVEALNELRSRNKIFGYRDGTTWKYKQEEVDRILAERQAEREAQEGSGIRLDSTMNRAAGGSGLDADLDELVAVDESTLSSSNPGESVLGEDPNQDSSSSSTVIGRTDVSVDEILEDEFGLPHESHESGPP
ncbi:MAG TPA: helix-turn-helix domain-containing protein, partial [Pirellulaceae bacterium]